MRRRPAPSALRAS